MKAITILQYVPSILIGISIVFIICQLVSISKKEAKIKDRINRCMQYGPQLKVIYNCGHDTIYSYDNIHIDILQGLSQYLTILKLNITNDRFCEQINDTITKNFFNKYPYFTHKTFGFDTGDISLRFIDKYLEIRKSNNGEIFVTLNGLYDKLIPEGVYYVVVIGSFKPFNELNRLVLTKGEYGNGIYYRHVYIGISDVTDDNVLISNKPKISIDKIKKELSL